MPRVASPTSPSSTAISGSSAPPFSICPKPLEAHTRALNAKTGDTNPSKQERRGLTRRVSSTEAFTFTSIPCYPSPSSTQQPQSPRKNPSASSLTRWCKPRVRRKRSRSFLVFSTPPTFPRFSPNACVMSQSPNHQLLPRHVTPSRHGGTGVAMFVSSSIARAPGSVRILARPSTIGSARRRIVHRACVVRTSKSEQRNDKKAHSNGEHGRRGNT